MSTKLSLKLSQKLSLKMSWNCTQNCPWHCPLKLSMNLSKRFFLTLLSRHHKKTTTKLWTSQLIWKIFRYFWQKKSFQPKLNELHKNLQNQQKSSKYADFFNFDLKLVAKRTMVVILRSVRIFWHPLHSWRRLSSVDIWVLRFVSNILLQWRHLAFFSFASKWSPKSALWFKSFK